MGYDFSFITEEICFAASQLADWDPMKGPLKEVIALFARNAIESPGLLKVMALFFERLEASGQPRKVLRRIVHHTVSAITSRQDGERLLSIIKRDLERFLRARLKREPRTVVSLLNEWIPIRYGFLIKPPLI
jgi:hypothetical protein